MTIRYRLNSSVISLSLLLMGISYFATFITMDVLSKAENIYAHQFRAINTLLKTDTIIQDSSRILSSNIFEQQSDRTEVDALMTTASMTIIEFKNSYAHLFTDRDVWNEFESQFEHLSDTTNTIQDYTEEKDFVTAKEILSNEYDRTFKNMYEYFTNLIQQIQDQADLNFRAVRKYGRNLFITYHILAASGALLGLFIIFTIRRYVIKPIRNLSLQVDELASGEGDLTKTIPVSGSDEMTLLAQNVNKFIEKTKNILAALNSAIIKANSVKDGTISSITENSIATTEISSNLQSIVYQISSMDSEVHSASESTTKLDSSVNLYENQIENQAAIVEQTTSSVSEMISSITNLSQIARNRQDSTSNLIQKINEGDIHVKDSAKSVQNINADVDTILEMVNIISNIAQQTNLLAMNAAIEAAHAGDAGKGFAVVADEIRKLSETSSAHAKSISSVLKETVNNINTATETTNFTESVYGEIKVEFDTLLNAFTEISQNSNELDTGGKQILETMDQLNQSTLEIKNESTSLKRVNAEIVSVISKLSEISYSINSSIKEINLGMHNITGGIEEMKILSSDLDDSMSSAESHVNRFKLVKS